MITDLLQTKSQQLEAWCRQRGYISKADLMRYGLDNYYLRAWRTVCEFVNEGRMRVVPKDECIFRNLRGKMRWYEWIEK